MKVAVPREIHLGERRVAATPDTVRRLIKMGFQVSVEAGAGAGCAIGDAQYEQAGATIVSSRLDLWREADVVIKVRPPELDVEQGRHEADALREGGALVSFIWPATSELLVDQLARRKATVLAMDQIPRITRAQKMDALSSMANIAGYRAVIEAASFFGRFFTGQMTAAGKVPPAQVLVIGAGVAGLAAVGTARGLGAIVKAFDTRSVVKEQVQSMGAEFLEVDIGEDGAGLGGYAKEVSPAFLAAEKELFLREARTVDIIITTALVPGKPAPKLLFADMVRAMKPGSVIVDLAAEAGGNCELTEPGKVVVKEGVTIIGYVDLPSRLAPTASQLYGTNICHLLSDMGGGANWHIDHENEVVRGALILEAGERRWPPPPKPATGPLVPVPSVQKAQPVHQKPPPPKTHPAVTVGVLALLGLFLLGLGFVAPAAFLGHFTVFVLACFIGWQVVWNVTPALHTPLMSVTNAISGIILIGGMLQVSGPLSSPVTILAAIAILLATINVGGGFLVTQRMLSMFQR